MRTVTLLPGRAKPLWLGHPWVYADSIAAVEEGPGDVVRVVDSTGRTVGRGWLSPASAIRVRLFARGAGEESEKSDGLAESAEELIGARLDAAAALRATLFPDVAATDAYRLVHAEGDGVPGLVVDRFGSTLVAQFSTRPLVGRREALAARLLRATGAQGLLARAGGKEEEEGIEPTEVPFSVGSVPEAPFVVREEGISFEVDLRRGQKTGHYADQRENRGLVAQVAPGARVLDLYAGTGGFSLRALRQGAKEAFAVDSSGPALATALRNAAHNGVAERLTIAEGDVLDHLDALSKSKTQFDLVVADPPRFAAVRGGLARALVAYRRLNAKAMARVVPGGFLATFSCSGAVDPETFAEIARGAARECGRSASVVRVLGAGPDHPVSLAAPEGRYLTGLLLRIQP